MSDEEIKDEIRHSTDSAVQSLAIIVRSLQQDIIKHREEELASREEYRKNLTGDVKLEMKTQFNGKMDSIMKQMDSVMKQLDTLITRSAPVIEQYEDKKGFWNTMGDNTKKVGIIGALFAGLIAIFTYLTKLSQ